MQDNGIGARHYSIRLTLPFLIFLITPYFKPGCFEYVSPVMSIIFDVGRIASAAIVLVIYLLRGKMSKIVVAITAYQSIALFSTIVNGGDIFGTFKVFVGTITFSMLIELAVKQSSWNLISALLIVLGIESVINSITIIMYPSGMFKTSEWFDPFHHSVVRNNWFLGYDNGHINYILPLACAYWIYATYKDFPVIYRIFGFAIIFGTVYFTWSAASVIGTTVFLLLAIMYECRLRLRVFKFKYLLIIIIITFLGLVIFRIQNYFAFFITDILGKDLTLSGRTLIWDRTLSIFAEHPLIGIGVLSRLENFRLIGAPHPHGLFLRVIFQTGIIGAVSMTIIFCFVVKSLNSTRNKYCYILSSTLFCFLIIFLTESFDNIMQFYGIVTMAYHINCLTAGMSEEEKRKYDSRLVHRNVEKAE